MSFGRLAPLYRWLETVLAGRTLQRARTAHLPVLDRAASILLAGEGPGRLLATLRARRPEVAITLLDFSAAMLRQARRAAPAGPTEFVHADLRTWAAPTAAYDAVVTSCVLDCFGPETLPDVIRRLARAARPAADWLQIDFALPDRGWRRARARAIHALMYAAFRIATGIEARRVTPPDPWLTAAGFACVARREFSAGLIRSEHWRRAAP